MVEFTKANGNITKERETGFILGQMGKNTSACSKMINYMVMVLLNGQTLTTNLSQVINTLEISQMV
jgi:hypothetical protein